ncbi:hypothetical protein BJ742DRAFT_828695 [Cladochytrium replicatum]|nr:hypothetical protein BJ742DRAFT_828695 [Cladochytrium replicatum]
MRPSVATIAALVAATIATLSNAPIASAAPARVGDAETNPLGHIGSNRLPYKINKRDEIDFNALALADENSNYDESDEPEDEELDGDAFNALAAGDYGYGGGDSSAGATTGTAAADTAGGAPAEAGSAPDSWEVALNMNPNDLPLLNNQAGTTTSGAAVQIGAPTDVNVDPNATGAPAATDSPTEQRQVDAPTDINIDGTTTGGAVQVGAPTDVNVDGTTTTTGTALQVGAPTDVNVDGTTTTTVYATPTGQAGGNNGGNVEGDFDCLEVLVDMNLMCKDVNSIDENEFNCIEDVDFGKDFMCTDVNGDEFDCEPLDGQTGAGGSDGSGGSGTDPSYGGSSGADSDAAGLAQGAASSWKTGVFKTGVATAFVLVASAAFFL